ncbi:MAG: hypothetical protein ACYS0G_16440 [Planctomycetota bacterium]|jgi:hypothetical protein
MNGEQLKKAQEIFEALADLPASERRPILDERCGDDAELRAFVERLLARFDRGLGDFLQSPEIEITKLFKGRGTRRDAPSE